MQNPANKLGSAEIGRVAQWQSVAFTQRPSKPSALRFSRNPDSPLWLRQIRGSAGRLVALALAVAVLALGCGDPARAEAEPIQFGCELEAEVWVRLAAGAVAGTYSTATDAAGRADWLLRAWRARGGRCPSPEAAKPEVVDPPPDGHSGGRP